MDKKKASQIKTNDLKRELVMNDVKVIRAEEGEEDTRTVELAFSSDADNLDRWFGTEQLIHTPEAVRLERLNNGGALLVDHNTRDQVGVVLSARVDSDGMARAVVKFSRSARGQEIYDDVIDKIRQLTSVSYRIHKYEVEEREGMPDLVRVTEWEPHEISIVSVPFDASVGVGRSENLEVPNPIKKEEERKMDPKDEKKPATPDVAKLKADTRKAELDRMNKIRSMSETHELPELGRQAIEEGWTYEDFNHEALAKIGERNNKARTESKHDGNVDLDHKEQKRYNLTALLHAIANPQDRSAQQRAAFELEVSDEAVKGFGGDFKARGVYIPDQVLNQQRALSAGTATAGAELVATDLLSGSFIETLRNASAMIQAGATMLPGLIGNVDIPRQTSGSTMGWIAAEDGDAPNGEPTFDQVSLSPKDAAVYTEMTRRSLQQTTPAIDGIVRRDIAMAIALGTDLAGLYGTGATGQPTGVANQVGINNPTFAAAGPTYLELLNMIRLVMEDNALMGMPSWIFGADGWEHLSTTPKQPSGVEGNFIMPDNTIKGYPTRMTQQVTAGDYFFGDWSQILIGEWGGLEVNVDPYTHSLKGKVRFVAFKTMDVAVRHPEAFAYGNDTI